MLVDSSSVFFFHWTTIKPGTCEFLLLDNLWGEKIFSPHSTFKSLNVEVYKRGGGGNGTVRPSPHCPLGGLLTRSAPASAISHLTVHQSCLPPSSVWLLAATPAREHAQRNAFVNTQRLATGRPDHFQCAKFLHVAHAAFWGGLQPITITLPTLWLIALLKPLTSHHRSSLRVATKLMVAPCYILRQKLALSSPPVSYIHTLIADINEQ